MSSCSLHDIHRVEIQKISPLSYFTWNPTLKVLFGNFLTLTSLKLISPRIWVAETYVHTVSFRLFAAMETMTLFQSRSMLYEQKPTEILKDFQKCYNSASLTNFYKTTWQRVKSRNLLSLGKYFVKTIYSVIFLQMRCFHENLNGERKFLQFSHLVVVT